MTPILSWYGTCRSLSSTGHHLGLLIGAKLERLKCSWVGMVEGTAGGIIATLAAALCFKEWRLRVVPFSLSPSCVTRLVPRAWHEILGWEARERRVPPSACFSSPGSHATILFFTLFVLLTHARRTKRKRDYSTRGVAEFWSPPLIKSINNLFSWKKKTCQSREIWYQLRAVVNFETV